MIQVRHKKRMGTKGLFFYHPNLLCCLDQMLAVMDLSQHHVSSSKTVRPIFPRVARCMGHVKIMWSAVCSLAPHSHFAEESRPHLCMDKPKRPTPLRKRMSLAQPVLIFDFHLISDFSRSLLVACGSVSWPRRIWPGFKELRLTKESAALWRGTSAGWMLERTGRLSVGVGRKLPVTMHKCH